MEEKKFKHSFLAKIENVNRNTLGFSQKINNYLKQFEMKNLTADNDNTFDRLLDLFRFTNFIVSDSGIINQENIQVIDKIKEIYTKNKRRNTKVYKKLIKFQNELFFLQQIKHNFGIYDEFNEKEARKLNNDIIQILREIFIRNVKVNNQSDKTTNIQENCVSFSEYLLSYCQSKFDNIDFLFYENSDEPKNPCDKETMLNFFQYRVLVEAWKYDDAKIAKDENGYIIDDVTNSTSFSQKITNMLLTDNTQIDSIYRTMKSISKNKRLSLKQIVDSYLMELGEDLYLNLRNSTNKDLLNKLRIYKVDDTSLQNIIKSVHTLKKESMKQFLFENKTLVSVEDAYKISDNYTLNKKNIERLIWNPQKDILDCPVVTVNNEKCFYLPAIILLNPEKLVYEYIKNEPVKEVINYRNKLESKNLDELKEKTFKNRSGKNFENEIAESLKKNKFEFVQNIKYGERHEYDILVRDKNNDLCMIECKTFETSFSKRMYRLQIDKLLSLKYIEKALRHFRKLKDKETLKNLEARFDKNSSTDSEKVFKDVDESKIYLIFVSNYIIPDTIKEKYPEICFIHWFEFLKIINKIDPNTISIYRNESMIPVSNPHPISISGFDRESIRRVGKISPTEQVYKHFIISKQMKNFKRANTTYKYFL
ncbi:hypothetical protein [Leuconostoc citreum]|uniref:hypothetical protein n=1 Tax=Leuconostoc citreum TaxID=33964 RepID=UPI0032DE8A3A